ncbi:MAG: hypothetical protein R3C00_02640 [Hyphomonas sp.]
MHLANSGKILVVVHGPGRGRDVPTGRVFLSRLRETDPQFARRLSVHATGSGPADLSGVALVLFWLGDPLHLKYPECYAEAAAIADAARERRIPLLNPPEGLSNTSKAAQAAIWAGAGIPSAAARLVNSADELLSAYDKFNGDCLVRSNVEHTQRDVSILRSARDAHEASANCAFPAVVIRLHDVRREYRAAGEDPHSLYARFHHKARAFVFRDKVIPSHLFFSRSMIVGLDNSLFAREARPRRRMARACGFRRDLFQEIIDEDLRYFGSNLSCKPVLSRAVRELGLDFAAVDYSIRPDGSPILWEANPYFYLPAGQASVLSTERHAVERVNQSLDWMAEQLRAAVPELVA